MDTVSGATYSSVGIIQAVRDALGQAAVNGKSEQLRKRTMAEQFLQSGSEYIQRNCSVQRRIYYGTAEGYSGDVSVAVVIQEKTIKAILVTETSDDEAFNRAMDVVKNVINTEYRCRYCIWCNLQF